MLEIAPSLFRVLGRAEQESRIASLLLHPYRTTTEHGNYLSLRRGNLSYLPKNRPLHVRDDGSWARTGFQSGRPARVVRKFIREPYSKLWLSDRDYEEFGNVIRAQDVSTLGSFSIVSGEDIRHYYNGRTYASGSGALLSSCMRYDECASFFDIYVGHERVRMVVFLDHDGMLCGRALLWNAILIDQERVSSVRDALFARNQPVSELLTGEEVTVLDRIYANDIVTTAFQEYADEQGWLWRATNSYTDERRFFRDGQTSEVSLVVPLETTEYMRYPYCDTFKYLSARDSYLTNEYNFPYSARLIGTGGHWE